LPAKYILQKVKLTQSGEIDFLDFQKKLGPDVIACFFPFVQSETGVIYQLEKVRDMLEQKKSSALLFVDSIQGIGKVPFHCDRIIPDFFTISGSKIGVPGGACAVYRNQWKKQLLSLRSELHTVGRLPVPFSVLLSERLAYLLQNMANTRKQIKDIKDCLIHEMKQAIPDSFEETVP